MLTLGQIMNGNMTPIQVDILLSKARFKVLLFGRQASKSTTLRILAYNALLSKPNTEVLYVLKTYQQSKELGWRFLIEGNDPLIPRHLIKAMNKSELTCELTNGSRIRFVGSENIDALVGLTIDFLIMDEVQSQKKTVWPYLQPMLAARKGYAVFAGTARGFDHLYELWWKGTLENPNRAKNWRSWKVKTSESGTPAGTEEALEYARNSMSPQMYAQEYEASPYALTGQIFPNYDPVQNNSTKQLDPELGLIVGMDMNIHKMCAVLYQKYGNEIHAVDELIVENCKTERFMTIFKNKYSRWGNRCVFWPDASGDSRRTSSNNTDHEIIRKFGYTVISKKSNPYVRDRLNTFSTMICNANGERRLFVSNKCQELHRCIIGITWKDGKMDKETDLDHAIDAASYPIYHLYNISTRGGMMQMHSDE